MVGEVGAMGREAKEWEARSWVRTVPEDGGIIDW